MADFFSQRFKKSVWITHHARMSMQRRHVDDATLEQVIEEGNIKHKSAVDMWLFKHIDGRSDNLICAAVIEQDAIIVKTVMINWELEDEI